MGAKVLITGAGGYLGSVLATELASLKNVDRITGTVHNTLPRIPLPSKVNLVKIDIRSPELSEVMAGHDYVIHSAFIVQWSAKMSAAIRDDINFNGTRNVAQAAIKNHIRGFVHASSIAAYDPIHAQGKENLNEDCPIGNGNSPMYYLNSKAIAEKILREVLESSNIPLTFFRISYITGPRDPATVRGFRENAVLFPGRNPRAQFVHENDVAQAFAQAIHGNIPGAFNVVPDDFIRLREVYKIIGARPLIVPVWLAHLVTFVRWRFFGSPTHPSWVQTTLIDFSFSNAKLKATGWMPHYSSAEAIRTAL
ncbi:MAG TPA: NAD-dependent epimerase/dehydratase family protein [Anaerolineales bacterium]|nr:NAD-dependent epimerase/dehydratase family protein [Anaerolineales bacterium]